MTYFQIKHYMLPKDGNIPGARGHKKQVIPRGTKIYCIVYGTKIYWAAYLNEAQAIECVKGLTKTVDGEYKRSIDLKTLVEWNFKDTIPTRIVRPKN